MQAHVSPCFMNSCVRKTRQEDGAPRPPSVWPTALWRRVRSISSHTSRLPKGFFLWAIWTVNKHPPLPQPTHTPLLPTHLTNLSHGLSNPHPSGHSFKNRKRLLGTVLTERNSWGWHLGKSIYWKYINILTSSLLYSIMRKQSRTFVRHVRALSLAASSTGLLALLWTPRAQRSGLASLREWV